MVMLVTNLHFSQMHDVSNRAFCQKRSATISSKFIEQSDDNLLQTNWHGQTHINVDLKLRVLYVITGLK
jgi:hypothetical protein